MECFLPVSLTESQQPTLESRELISVQQIGVALYDGDDKTPYEGGIATVTSHRVIWISDSMHLNDKQTKRTCFGLSLSLISRVESKPGFLRSSPKIILYLGGSEGKTIIGETKFVKLSFREGGQILFQSALENALMERAWKNTKPVIPTTMSQLNSSSSNQTTRVVGISGLFNMVDQQNKDSESNIADAFKDLDALMEKAKAMVTIAEKFTAKIAKSSGAPSDVSTEDQSQFQEYLLNLGISSPVTKETHGTGKTYHKELARQLSDFLKTPLEKRGGMMLMADAYCLFNRARGTALISPEDLIESCEFLDKLALPVRFRKFNSGVLVIQLAAFHDSCVVNEISALFQQRGIAYSLTVAEYAALKKISPLLSREFLLQAESNGVLCRDESPEGLRFFVNMFVR